MPATYEPIATTTLGSAAAGVTFSSIPSTYTDLRLIITATNVSVNDDIQFQFNSDTGTNYSWTRLSGNGTSAASSRTTSATQLYATDGGNLSTTIPGLAIIDIFSYAGSTNKTCLINGSFDQNGSGWVERNVGLWRSTAAINTIYIFSGGIAGAYFATGSRFTLYGIKAA
jgi:hypothetical protein